LTEVGTEEILDASAADAATKVTCLFSCLDTLRINKREFDVAITFASDQAALLLAIRFDCLSRSGERRLAPRAPLTALLRQNRLNGFSDNPPVIRDN